MGSIISDWRDLKTAASNYGWRVNARPTAAASQEPIRMKQTGKKNAIIPLIKHNKCWPEVEKEEWRTDAPTSKINVKYFCEIHHSDAQMSFYSAVTHFCNQIGRQQPKFASGEQRSSPRWGKLQSRSGKSRIMSLVLWRSHIPADARQLKGTNTQNAHTRTTVLHLLSWLHPVTNNDKYVKTVTKSLHGLAD